MKIGLNVNLLNFFAFDFECKIYSLPSSSYFSFFCYKTFKISRARKKLMILMWNCLFLLCCCSIWECKNLRRKKDIMKIENFDSLGRNCGNALFMSLGSIMLRLIWLAQWRWWWWWWWWSFTLKMNINAHYSTRKCSTHTHTYPNTHWLSVQYFRVSKYFFFGVVFLFSLCVSNLFLHLFLSFLIFVVVFLIPIVYTNDNGQRKKWEWKWKWHHRMSKESTSK